LLKKFNDLFRIFKELGITTKEKVQEMKELVEAYPNVKYEISCLKKEKYNLKNQMKDLEQVLADIHNKSSLATTINEELKVQIKNNKIILQNLEILEKRKISSVYNENIKKIIESTVKDEYWYKTTILPLMIISVFEVIRNDPIGKNMLLDYYNNNIESIYNIKNNNKETNIADTIHHTYNNYLPIIMDINEYSKKLHENILQIYPPYLFSMILKMPNFDISDNLQNNQKEYENYKHYNNNKFYQNLGN